MRAGAVVLIMLGGSVQKHVEHDTALEQASSICELLLKIATANRTSLLAFWEPRARLTVTVRCRMFCVVVF